VAFDSPGLHPCAGSETASADGPHTFYAVSADASGNKESPVKSRGFKIDQTPPTLAPTVGPVTLHQAGATASPHAADATSGLTSSSCGPVDSSTAGDHTVTCTATDNAGNTNSATIHYLVGYQILGFFSPGVKGKAGSTSPIKIALADSAGTRISDSDATAAAAAHRVTFSVSGAQTLGPQNMAYDAGGNQFQYDWHLGSAKGPAVVSVTVTYPGTSATTTMTESITIT
jgi:hypothetical protein